MSKLQQMPFSKLYQLYLAKAQKKGRTKSEVDQVLAWFSGYKTKEFEEIQTSDIDLSDFIKQAPLNPNRHLITGVVCGIRVETIEDPFMKELRYMDKLIDELAKGKSTNKIIRNEILL